MAHHLTQRQQEVLEFIQFTVTHTGFPPTRAEIATALGFRSANAAEDHLKALARKQALELTPGTSRGIRLKQTHKNKISPLFAGSDRMQARSKSSCLLPLIGQVAAGHPILAIEHIECEVEVDPHLFTPSADFLLKVRGLSMKDIGILEGDLLAIKQTVEARDGQIIVARLDEEVTVKRLRHLKNHIELHAENPEFEPIIVSNTQDFVIEGIAVGLIRTQTLR